jgi:hypothetical protein
MSEEEKTKRLALIGMVLGMLGGVCGFISCVVCLIGLA